MHTYYLFNLLIFLTNALFLHKFFHIYQLKDYNNIRYLQYFFNIKSIFILLCFVLFIFELLIKNFLFYIVTNIFIYILNLFYLINLIKSSKTPLKFTKKLSRLIAIAIIILFLLCFYKHSFLLLIALTFLTPPLANVINIYDKIKNQYYINQASKKLKNHPAQIIAITGSNGKTSVKNILAKMLSTEHIVQSTPASFNTPLGIAKFINNELLNETEFLILEYGARHKNDIKKLCNLFGADCGIITTISSQHLESFKSTENIFKAKQQLANFLQNKLCVFNIDNLYSKRMFEEKSGIKTSVSINQQADVFAEQIRIENAKTKFDIIINNQRHSLHTSLLGQHNVLNICLATALACHFEISTENIIASIESLEQIPHRLSLTQIHINILDDTYNCSPTSATEALRVLKSFSGKKMIVTPGIIECGKEKFGINFNLGKQLAFCDFCVIVGNENKKAIFDGLKTEITKTTLQPKIFFTNTLDDAKQYFNKLNHRDTLLLLNDLPDDYK